VADQFAGMLSPSMRSQDSYSIGSPALGSQQLVERAAKGSGYDAPR